MQRKTRNILVRKISVKALETMITELVWLREDFGTGFSRIFKTITSDNNSKFSDLKILEISGTKFYFTHHYSYFERGTNERGSGLL